jgi:hypothetical protein
VNSLENLAILGMRNISSSNMFLLSFYLSGYNIELEQSSYDISLAYRNFCLNIHTTYMVRIRTKLRWWFVVPLGLPKFYAC